MAKQSNNWVIAIIAVIIITGIAMHQQQTIVGRSSFAVEYERQPSCQMIGDTCMRNAFQEFDRGNCCSNAYCAGNTGARIGTCVNLP